MTGVRSERLGAAIERATRGEGDGELVELLGRSSGLPGPRANYELARVVGTAIAARGTSGEELAVRLARLDDEFTRVVVAMALVAQSLAPAESDKRARGRGARALERLQALAEDPRQVVRDGVVEALRGRLRARGPAAVEDLAAWTDGYLQAYIALEAMADRAWLTTVPSSEGVIARLDEAFALADDSPRAAERTQGLRALRQGLPGQIVTFATRFREALAWLEEKTKATRPETREVVAEAIRGLRRTVLSDVQAGRLAALHEATAKPRRDADRVVHGTRKRSRGRS